MCGGATSSLGDLSAPLPGRFTVGPASKVVVIANPSAPDSSVSKSELENLLLGKASKWGNGERVVLVNLKDSGLHAEFTKEFTGKTTSQYKTYWKKRIFTGKGKGPKEIRTEKLVVDYVARTPGAIGYISLETSRDAKVMNDSKSKKPRVQLVSRK